MYLPLPATIAALILAIAVFVLARWRAGQPLRPERGPRMIPWTLIAVAAGGLAIIFAVHLAELAGLDPSQLPRRF